MSPHDGNVTKKSPKSHSTALNYSRNQTEKQERMITMKKIWIVVLSIGVIAGAALAAFIIRDGLVSIPEAIAAFAYLALVQVGGMLALRGAKVNTEENNPSRPLALMKGNAAQNASAQKHAA